MAGYKNNFIKYFHFINSAFSTEKLIKLSKQNLLVPVYHLISDIKVPHVEHLYKIKNTQAFKKDLDFLLKHYQPISYNDLLELKLKGEQVKKNTFLLTFDDGLSEFHNVVAPILIEKGIPAINFLNSDFVDNKNLFFRYKVSLLIEKISKNETLLNDEKVKKWFQQFDSNLNYKRTLLGITHQNKNLLDDLASLLSLDFDLFLKEKEPYLTSNQIFDLQKKGFGFGAHSVNHPEYRFLTLEEQIQQTTDCLAFLEKNSLSTNKTFAFPFTDYGVKKDFFDELLKEQKIVDISFACGGLKYETFPCHIQRVPLELGNLGAKQIVNSEYVYFLLKKIFGRKYD
ncbi:MAG: polysaccharide deacetylase family protein [Bacteroidota bacterium]